MPIDITSADRGMIYAVLANLRPIDALEMAACGIDLQQLPTMIMRHKIFAFCAYDTEAGPVAIWGLVQRREGVAAGFAFGTDRWGDALLPMVHQINRFVFPFLLQAGIHRVEAAALAGRDDVARFMELIGAEPEGLLRGYGTGGEDFVSYRWLADEHERRNQRSAADSQAHCHTAH